MSNCPKEKIQEILSDRLNHSLISCLVKRSAAFASSRGQGACRALNLSWPFSPVHDRGLHAPSPWGFFS